jgi:secreted PhoX family phosphatase
MKRFLVFLVAMFSVTSVAFGQLDFGERQERALEQQSRKLFGFGRPVERTATAGDVIPREFASAGERQFLAGGLRASFVARNVAQLGDMISFWPTDTSYTHLIVCIEQGRAGTGQGPIPGVSGQNAAVQRVNVSTGQVETILYGMSRCDGIRTTPWGTVVATEETGDGGAYEILFPLQTTSHWIADRGTGDVRDGVNSATASEWVVKRGALVTQAWEGLEFLDSGVVIGGDELRPAGDADGGAIFRFVPDQLYNCVGAPVRPGQLCSNVINDLEQSPLVGGTNYALATVCTGTNDFGQGCEAGRGLWIEVGAATAREDANERGATGYCRPEDLHVDRSYGEFAGGEGIRYCWTNTCGGGFGEVLCAVEDDMDATQSVFNNNFQQNLLSTDGMALAEALVSRFVQGDGRMSSHDNLDFQPITSNVYVIEDDDFGEVWACLPDGADRDFASDGCVATLGIRDPNAEPTGFIFDGTGTVAYYILQHGQQPGSLRDFTSNPVDGTTDDLIKVTGFRIP